MTTKNEIKERLEKRVQELKSCQNAEEMAFAIWTRNFESATGSSKKSYRDGFINWIESYKSGETPKWKYKNPEELANAIWEPFLDEPEDEWFPALRTTLKEWIRSYVGK